MYSSRRFVLPGIVSFISLLVLIVYCTRVKPPVVGSQILYSSPTAVFDSFREARGKRDWRSCFLCLTPAAQNEAVFEMYFASAESGSDEAAAICKKYVVDDDTLNDDFRKRYREKHGIDFSKRNDAAQAPTAPPDRDLIRDVVCAHIEDKAGYYEAVSNLFKTEDAALPIGSLDELTVHGDTATGRAVTVLAHFGSSGGEPSKRFEDKIEKTFTFRRIDGRWLIGAE